MKAGCPAFVDETPVPFEDAVSFIRGTGAIVVYPTVADGADPICGYEDPVEDLVERLGQQDIYGAELVTVRNTPECVDRYVKAWRDAGIFVTAGTEHNTLERIPVDPTCVGGVPISEASRDIFWEGVCVVAAHQQRKQQGQAGYVDETGALNPGFPDAETRIRYFAEMGAELIYEATRDRPMTDLTSSACCPSTTSCCVDAVEMSQRFGRDPEYTRGGGGNSSVKADGIVYIKPSGVSLAEIEADDLVPLATAPLLDLLLHGRSDEDEARIPGAPDPVMRAAAKVRMGEAKGRRPIGGADVPLAAARDVRAPHPRHRAQRRHLQPERQGAHDGPVR